MSLPSSGKMLWVVSFSGFLTGFDYTALNIAMPTLSTEFNASYSLTSWVLLAYALIFVAGAIPASNLMRIHGLRRMMTAGFAIYALGSALCVFAPSLVSLSVFRAIQGLGGTILFVAGPTLIRQHFPEDQRGRGYNVAVLAPTIGLCAGPALGGLILAALDWRWIFVANLPVCAAGLWVMVARLDLKPPCKAGANPDMLGSALLFVTLVAFVFAINQGTELGWTSTTISLAFGGSALGLGGFIWRKLRAPTARTDLRALATPAFLSGSVAVFLLLFLVGGLGFCLPIYLELIKSVPLAWGGALLSVQPVTVLALALVAGQVAMWKTPQYRSQFGVILTVVYVVIMIAGTYFFGPLGIVIIGAALVVSGLGRGVGFPPVVQMTLDPVAPSQAVTASGTMTTARTLGQLVGIVVFETILSGYIGVDTTGVTPTAHDIASFRLIFGTALVVSGLALFTVCVQSRCYATSRTKVL